MRAGVYIFFVLSGYLLTRSFLAAYLIGTPMPSIARYFRNRALRIAPGFWVVATVYMFWNHLWSVDWKGILALYGFASNYHLTPAAGAVGQAWTLDLEVAFYILIPISAGLALLLGRRLQSAGRRLAGVLAVLVAAYAVSLYCRHLAGIPEGLAYNLADYLFAFIPGVALAAVEPFLAPRLRERRSGRAVAWALLLCSIAVFAAFIAVPVSSTGARLLLISLACGLLVSAPLVLQWATGSCWRVLDNRVMRWLGERSYGIYLIHLGLMTHVLARFGHGHGVKSTFVLLLFGVTAATLLAADVLWRLVERPALQRRLPWRQSEFARETAQAA
jgi:peptidoglycan/LPS O-acetylase OafA/YrhL